MMRTARRRSMRRRVDGEVACNDHSGASTTVHKLSKYVWFCSCCCCPALARNEMERKTQLGRTCIVCMYICIVRAGDRVATQCNDERKIDMHVISRIRTSTRIADVDDVVCSATPRPLPHYIPFTYINYAVYVSTSALPFSF